MKKVLSSIIIVLLVFTTISVFVVSGEDKTENRITLTYYFEIPKITKLDINGNIYSKLTLEDTLSGDETSGYPSLPNKEVYILIPQGEYVDSIRVTGENIFLGKGFIIEPTEEPICSTELDLVSTPTPDDAVYKYHEPYPGKLYSEVSSYSYKGYRILVLLLHPVQYIPITGELYYYPKLTVDVTFVENGIVEAMYRGLEKDKPKVFDKVDNPEFVCTYNEILSSQPSNPSASYDLLIITDAAFVNNFQPLKDKHDGDGIHTIIKTVSEITSDQEFWYDGPWGDGCNKNMFNDTQCKIRNFIRMAYHVWGIDYVLLGGDNHIVPARNLYFGRWQGTAYSGPSDVYYACLDGNFNYNQDNKWGERFDGRDINGPFGDVDLYSEVYVGRACVDSQTEVNNFVSKTISYLNIDPNDDYLDNVTLAGERLLFFDWNGNGWGKTYLEQLPIPSTYNIYKLYDRDWQQNGWPEPNPPGSGGWSKGLLIDSINNGVHIINHVGHSNYNSVMKLDVSDINALTNNKYSFVYSQGCFAGGFDNDDCIAEYLTVKTSHGAFAGIFNARLGFLLRFTIEGPAQRYQREFWDAVFNEGVSIIGKAHQDAKEDNVGLINFFQMRYTYYQLNLFGDPTLDLLIHNGDGASSQDDEIIASNPINSKQESINEIKNQDFSYLI